MCKKDNAEDADSADGERLVKKSVSERIDELLAEMPPGKKCPKCGGMMVHERLRGYRCFRGCE